MDSNFPIWLHLRITSRISIEKIISTIKRLFGRGELPLTLKVFRSEKALDAYLKQRALMNNKLGVFLENANRDSEEDEDPVDGDLDDGKEYVETAEDTVGHATVTHEITAVGYYAEFLGCSFASAKSFIIRLGHITKYLQQADVSLRIQDNVSTLRLFRTICEKLRERQVYINARIIRWLHLGNLAETRTSLLHFGYNELQPFIELCMRYTFLPMTTSRLRTMRMVLDTLPTDLDERYGTTARSALFAPATKTSGVDDVIFLDGDHLTHVSMVYSNMEKSDTNGKLVARPIGQALSLYMFFFFKYCKGNWNTQINRTHTVANTHLLFSQVRGGSWKYLLRHVRIYAEGIKLPFEEMGLTRKTSSYMHQSRVSWVASRASDMNINRIAADAKAVKMGFAQEHTFYPGLESLRDSQRARTRLGGTPEPSRSDMNLTLTPVPEALYPLLMELQNKSSSANPLFDSKTQPEYTWYSVENDDSLYSRDIKALVKGKRSIKKYLQDERKKVHKKQINMKELNLRGSKRYPTNWW